MKNALKIVAVALMLFVAPTIGKSQKMAHFSLDSLLEIMPEFKAASDSAQLYYKMLENQMKKCLQHHQRYKVADRE